ncbi:MAG: hypothetical protein ABJE95_15395 [Byssovorax sp.]
MSIDTFPRRLGVATAFFAAMSLASGEACAQSDAQRTGAARALFDQAVTQMESGDYEGACPKLEASVKLEPEALGAKLTLAACYEGGGQLASAWSTYLQVEEAAGKAKQTARQVKAHERVEALRPKLAQLILVVPEDAQDLPGLTIVRDGFPIERGLWSVPLPVDRGSHEIVMTATGKKTITRTFDIEQDGQSLTVNLPRFRREAPSAPVVHAPARAEAPTARSRPRVHVESDDPRSSVELLRVNADFSSRVSRVGLTAKGPTFGALTIDGMSTSSVCAPPCDIEVDTSGGQQFFFGGEGVSPSSRFRLQGKGDPVMLTVSPGSKDARFGGILLLCAGIAGIVGGGAMITVSNGQSGSLTAGGGVALGLGVVSMGISVPVFRASQTTFSILGDGLGVQF